MASYAVNHSYTSRRDGQKFGPWSMGELVDLADADAEWVNRDSPGCLTEVGSTIVAERGPERQAPATPNRQHKGGRNRAGG